ncbi:hypothetical protein [Phormidesmis priestleyi]|uniref:hypothetical protein n=1 Tax=Phormidesmis priestleyi TaxID=268141 RepID=UPI000B171FB9|nr:hypothetical protein [Phormidesmis priestleyi]
MTERLLLAIIITFSLNCLLGLSATSAQETAGSQPMQAIQKQVTMLLASAALHDK